MDRIGASYEYSIESIRQRLGANPIAMQMPIGSEGNFTGVIDLLTMQAIYWEDELGRDPIVREIPDELQAADAKAAREIGRTDLPNWMTT